MQSNRISTRQAQLYAGTTAKGTAYTVATSTTAFNITAGSWTRAELQNARIRLYAVRGTSNTGTNYYFRFYGVSLLVNYTVNSTEYEITINNSTSIITEPTGTTYLIQGENQEIVFFSDSITGITVTDNGTTVMPTQRSNSTILLSPTEYSDVTFTTTYMQTPEYGCNSSANTQDRARFAMRNTNYNIYYDFPAFNIPNFATIISVSCTAKAHVQNSSYYPSLQLYSGTSPKGTAVNVTSTTSGHTEALDTGTWTAAELNNVRLRLHAVGVTSSQSSYAFFFGATVGVVYSYEGEYFYTISNISADHTIVISEASTGKTYAKTSTGWAEMQKIYKKVNGSWVEQTPDPSIFDPNEIYLRNI